jgi:hypothetical protein
MILEHYSDATRIDLTRPTPDQRGAAKPVGLWLSVPSDCDWPGFCVENYPQRLSPERHLVTLRGDADLLVLDSHEAVLGLAARFPDPRSRSVNPRYHDTVDWAAVAREYDGIVIPTYQRDMWRHIEANWYYTWDCSCACIWNMDAIEGCALDGAYVPQTVVLAD